MNANEKYEDENECSEWVVKLKKNLKFYPILVAMLLKVLTIKKQRKIAHFI